MKKERKINALIGKRIVLLRSQKNLSRSKLARVLEITHQQLDKYEKGINRISAAKIAMICKELKVSSLFFYSNLIMENSITETIQNDLNKLITYFIHIESDTKRQIITNLTKELVL